MLTAAPPTDRERATLHNWQDPPYNRWAFSHVRELIPTQRIARAAAPATPLPTDLQPLGDVRVGTESSVDVVLDATSTDGVVVVHRGRVVFERYAGETGPRTPHLLMSVSKSIVGCVVANLVERGHLARDRLITDHVPELLASGYRGARLQDLLDMRSGIRFSEVYTDLDAEVRVLEQAVLWRPRTRADLPDSMYAFLTTLQAAREHGGVFEYRSCETDVLGWVCESAAGARMAGLLSDLVWRPMGAEHAASLAVDHEGSGMFDGGISASLRDLLRFGAVWLGDGTALDGTQVIGPNWVEETLRGDVDSDAAFAGSKDGPWMPGGMYRNQMWFPSPRRDTLVCLGIHGQMVYVNRTAGVVAAKLSSWPDPQDPGKLFSTLAAFDAVATALGG